MPRSANSSTVQKVLNVLLENAGLIVTDFDLTRACECSYSMVAYSIHTLRKSWVIKRSRLQRGYRLVARIGDTDEISVPRKKNRAYDDTAAWKPHHRGDPLAEALYREHKDKYDDAVRVSDDSGERVRGVEDHDSDGVGGLRAEDTIREEIRPQGTPRPVRAAIPPSTVRGVTISRKPKSAPTPVHRPQYHQVPRATRFRGPVKEKTKDALREELRRALENSR